MLLLDEPTNHLDPGAQLELLGLIRSLEHRTRVVVLHDLDHALAFADQVVVLAQGRVRASGAPRDALAGDVVSAVFGVRSAITEHPITGAPHLTIAPPR